MGVSSQSIHLLHVDDEPDLAEMVAEFLQRSDDRFSVDTVASASEGFDQLNEKGYDCIVSDYDMPGRNGIDFLKAVREENADLPFILYTGKGSEEIASEAIHAGVTDYLQKEGGTSQYEVLANRINNAVEQHRSKEAAVETEQRLQTIAENTNDILWKFTADWNELLFINSAYEEIWGRSLDELRERPQSFLEGIHPDDRDLVKDAMGQLSAGDSVDIEYQVNAAEDFGRWVWVQGEPVFDGDGEVEKVVGFARDITDRKEREQELKEKQAEHQLYRRAFEGATDLLAAADTEYNLLFANERYRKYHELSRDDVGQLSLPEYLGDAWEEVKPYIDRTLAGEYLRYEMERETLDGDTRTLDIRYYPLSDDGGTTIGAVTAMRDVTERKEREQLLEQLELNVTDIVWMSGPEKESMDFISDSYEKIFGRSAESLREDPLSFVDAIHPEDRERVQAAVEDQQQQPDDYEETYRIIRPDGEQRWIHDRSSGVYENGELTRIVGIASDISDCKEYELELEQAHELNQALTTTLPDYTFIYNAAGDYLDVVTGWEGDAMSYSPDELIGQNVQDLLNTETAERILEAIQTTLDTGELQTVEYKIEAPRGTIWYEAGIAPLASGYGGEPAVVLTARDNTGRRARQRELQRQNDRLKAFAATVSHDLRNPLSVAEGNLQLAIEEDNQERLDAVAQALSRMGMLIDDLLTLAKAGDALGETESVELLTLTESCWRNVETGSATLVAETDQTIQVDETRLRQLLENLFRNAFEHGGPQVRVTVGDLPGGFFVEDDGPGIPEENREDTFVPGYSTREVGTGFGLSIVRDIAKAHDWQVGVTDGDDGGARFEFTGVES